MSVLRRAVAAAVCAAFAFPSHSAAVPADELVPSPSASLRAYLDQLTLDSAKGA